jgi:hypothetical protein
MQCNRVKESGTWSRTLKAARHEISKPKAVIGSSSIVELANLSDWIKPYKSGGRRFPADDAPQLQLRNRFSVLEIDIMEAVQQGPGLLKPKDR